MADYHTLLQRLVAGIPADERARRQAVYDRARAALSEQLKTLDPPLDQAAIDREGRSLEDAIARVEAVEASLPPPPEPVVEPAPPLARRLGLGRLDSRNACAAGVSIRRGGKRPRSGMLALALVGLAVPVAILAWLWRDRPAPTPGEPSPVPEVVAPAPAPEVKYGERVVGEPQGSRPPGQPAAPAAPASPPPQALPPASQPTTPSPPPDEASRPRTGPAQEIAVAQRALIFEENQADPQKPTLSSGRAVWRLDALNGGPGQPLETVIRGQIDLPEAGLSLSLLIRRNLDPALPASHTIELTFTNTRPNEPSRAVRDVALPMMRPEEGIRGIALVGLPVPVKDNVFLVGLSDLKADIDKNLELLLRRNWMELPIRFASGQKAALLFDKGVPGERIFLEAFRQWGQGPPEQKP